MKKTLAIAALSAGLVFVGCEPNGPAPDSPQAGKTTEKLPAGFVAYYDGAQVVASLYEVFDGNVVVDGDIVLGEASQVLNQGAGAPQALGKTSSNIMVGAMPGQANHWPSGRIPYLVETDAARTTTVQSAIREWNAKAPAIWVPKTSQDVDYVAFVNHGTTNNSLMGKVGGRQIINLSPSAVRSTAMHEMGHASGLYHEQQRSDRDNNVTITASPAGTLNNNNDFSKVGTAVGSYDPTSLMHYSPQKVYYVWSATCGCWAFSPTATANSVTVSNRAGSPAITPGSTLSSGDLLGLRGMYMNALPYDAVTAKSLTTGINWPYVKPFKSGGVNYILHYNPVDGQFRTYAYSQGLGIVESPVEWGSWNSGWTTIEFYIIGSQTYALFYNRNSGTAYFYTMQANGKLGSWIESQSWFTEWDIAHVYKPSDTQKRYMLLYSKSSSRINIWGMKANGALDLSSNPFSSWWSGYEDIQIMEDVPSVWHYSGTDLAFHSTFLLAHDAESSLQYFAELNANGGFGQSIYTAGIGTGFTQVSAYYRNNRTEALYYNKSTGAILIFDVRPEYTGQTATPALTSAGFSAIRSHKSSANYQVFTFNVYPWGNGTDPKGADRLLLFDQGLKRFWHANLVPFPSI
ncbi:MAG: M12 family metallopeptidase [Fibrobacteria bacterium]